MRRTAGARAALLALAGVTSVAVLRLEAQTPPRQGLEVGWVSAEHVGTEFETGRRSGFSIGAFGEVETPLDGLWLRALGRWVRRGSEYTALDDRTTKSQVQTDELSMAVLFSPRMSLGPITLLSFVGPSVDYSVASKSDALFDQRFPDRVAIGSSFLLGAGLAAEIGTRGRVSAEMRWAAGLRPSFQGAGADPDSRSIEWLVTLSR